MLMFLLENSLLPECKYFLCFCVKFATILTQKYTSKKYIIVNILSIKFYHVAQNKKAESLGEFVSRS